jgi:ATP/maltotriose-dependent transcriptional regulator MalT
MATTAKARSRRSLQRRRIIDRPRLLALLDESHARVRTLVAPAGYGKTTLAEQWVAREGRTWAWYTARSSSADVAGLALGVARAVSALVPESDVRLREHLRVARAPTQNVNVLAEIVGEELASWPATGWLVLDEYQELTRAPEAERFVEVLLAESPVQLLIASRRRPAWVTSRSLLYGEVLEVNQTALAMDSHEAAEILDGWSESAASGLVSLANGWPAVIGLAGVSSPQLEVDATVPESLYRFFAEEVFDALGEDVRSGLATLAVAPVIDRGLAHELLGPDGEQRTCPAALDVGILVERGQLLELHPLARAFLEDRADRVSVASASALETCLAHYRRGRDWDAAFELMSKHGWTKHLEAVLLDALDELLDTARLSTLESWCALAAKAGSVAPVVSLARAEVALRYGRHVEAQTFGEAAASVEGSDLRFRAVAVAGRAAHLASREEEALELYRRAEAAATTEAERRDALWGQLYCAVELELSEAASALDMLTNGVRPSDPREVVRAATGALCYQTRLGGGLDLSQADRAWQLLDSVDDPLVKSAFLSIYASSLGLCGLYKRTMDVARALLTMTQRYRLDFAVPYALWAEAVAQTGMRRWSAAHQRLAEAVKAARGCHDLHAEQICTALHLRLLIQQGRYHDALEIDLSSLEGGLPAARAELFCARALAFAVAGMIEPAQEIVAEMRGSTRALEAAVLVPAVDAVCALKTRRSDFVDRLRILCDVAFSTGALDLLVATYRSSPELLTALLSASSERDRVADLLRRVGDQDLARVLGNPIGVNNEPRTRLSRREREVYNLLCEGLTNRQIAELLFISESTAKLHAQHIYDKLGIHSRTALAMQAVLERSDQATSATGTSESEVTS